MKRSVADIHDCYGCGVCSAACPIKIIDIGLNDNGFYEPVVVNADRCTDCGLCRDVCSYVAEPSVPGNAVTGSWAGWSDDVAVRQKCSSGGIGFEICRQLLARGYRIVACRYNADTGRAEHFVADNEKSLIEGIGSKYIQSFTPDAFGRLERDGRYAIVAAPCQIDSLRRLIERRRMSDNVVLIDFFCHCVPSMLVWKAYLGSVEAKIGKVTYASWRNKFGYGWHDSWIMSLDNADVTDEEGHDERIAERKGVYESRMSQGDMFYRLFLGGVAVNPACHESCRFKYDKSSADIRLGDLWGDTYAGDEKGVSAVVAFTDKGRDVVKSLEGVTLREHPFEVVAEGQMRGNAPVKLLQPAVLWLLRHGVGTESLIFKSVLTAQRIVDKIKRILT